RQFHFAAIMPQGQGVGVNSSGGYAWPGSAGGEPAVEQELIGQWTAAQRPFDEVFVVGFSSGAYFATSLALRDRLKADGYVLLAGGAPAQPAADVHQA